MQLESLKEGKRKGLSDRHNVNAAAAAAVSASTNKQVKLTYDKAEVKRVLEIIKRNGHKLDPPPICRIK